MFYGQQINVDSKKTCPTLNYVFLFVILYLKVLNKKHIDKNNKILKIRFILEKLNKNNQ